MFYVQVAQPQARLRELQTNTTSTNKTATTNSTFTANVTTVQKYEGFGAAFGGVANTNVTGPVVPISTYNFWGSQSCVGDSSLFGVFCGASKTVTVAGSVW